jgi:hypothetical protein
VPPPWACRPRLKGRVSSLDRVLSYDGEKVDQALLYYRGEIFLRPIG